MPGRSLRRQGEPSGALESEAKIPEEVSNEAAEVEMRMQTVCEYYLSDDREMKPRLDLLRPGTGHRDLARDLNGYAKIFSAPTPATQPKATRRPRSLSTRPLRIHEPTGSMSRLAR